MNIIPSIMVNVIFTNNDINIISIADVIVIVTVVVTFATVVL